MRRVGLRVVDLEAFLEFLLPLLGTVAVAVEDEFGAGASTDVVCGLAVVAAGAVLPRFRHFHLTRESDSGASFELSQRALWMETPVLWSHWCGIAGFGVVFAGLVFGLAASWP
jgi:hypothetical protein